MKLYVVDREGRELVLGEMAAGEYFGEMVLDGGPRSASIMTLEKTRFAVVSREAFVEYLNANPAFSLRLIKQLIRRVRTLTGSVKSLALLDVCGRVARLLIDLAERDGDDWVVAGRLTHQEIASRIGSSREMATRILKDLHTGGYGREPPHRRQEGTAGALVTAAECEFVTNPACEIDSAAAGRRIKLAGSNGPARGSGSKPV